MLAGSQFYRQPALYMGKWLLVQNMSFACIRHIETCFATYAELI